MKSMLCLLFLLIAQAAAASSMHVARVPRVHGSRSHLFHIRTFPRPTPRVVRKAVIRVAVSHVRKIK